MQNLVQWSVVKFGNNWVANDNIYFKILDHAAKSKRAQCQVGSHVPLFFKALSTIFFLGEIWNNINQQICSGIKVIPDLTSILQPRKNARSTTSSKPIPQV